MIANCYAMYHESFDYFEESKRTVIDPILLVFLNFFSFEGNKFESLFFFSFLNLNWW